jgi:hypothetical protein
VLGSRGYNALGVSTDCNLQKVSGTPSAAPDLIGLDPRMGDLTDNGEPGEAHVPLLAGSPLIDAGGKVFASCSPRDQLGNRRRDGDHDGIIECDIGAVEFRGGQH